MEGRGEGRDATPNIALLPFPVEVPAYRGAPWMPPEAPQASGNTKIITLATYFRFAIVMLEVGCNEVPMFSEAWGATRENAGLPAPRRLAPLSGR